MTMVFSHKNAIFATKSNNKDREMISNVKKIWCLLVLLLWVQHSTGQTGRVFDADHQLSSSFTTQVFQDRDGFVWVLTRNGINIYDGYQFKIIKKEQAGNRLASNYVNCMAQDDTGLFYLGMDCALQTYDGYEFADVKVKDLAGYIVACYTNCLLRCRSGELLAGTSGHGVLRIADREHAEQLGGVLADVHTVYDMVEDKQGHVWMATSDAGLVEYDGKSLKRHFGAEGQVSSLRCLRVDKSGTLYVGTSNGGVYVRRWQQTGRTGGEWQSDFEQLKATAGRHVSALYVCDDGRLMVGFDGQGVGICDTTTGEMDDNPYYSYDVDLRMSKVYSILEDGSGNIWLGLLQKGIYMQNKQTTSFRYMGRRLGERNVIGHACVISTMIDSKGRCWVGTDKDGLYCLDEHQRMLRHFKAGCPTSVMSIAEDHEGRIWVGSYREGFGYIDTGLQAYHRFPQYTHSSGFSIVETADKRLWIGTMGEGLLSLQLTTNHITAYVMHPKAPEDSTTNSIANNYISTITLSPDGKRIYAATTQGLCCLDLERESWTSSFGRNCLKYGQPVRIAREYAGRIWIGTNNGLWCYDMLKKDLQLLTTEHGLADNGIAAIEQDSHGRLWIGTNHGLCCHDPRTGQTESYFVDNGLQSNEFSEGASWAINRDGSTLLLFGGVGGITWFHPEDIKAARWDATVRLVDFVVGGISVKSMPPEIGKQVCDTTVIAATRFRLSPHDNTFSVRFSTLTYDSPEHTTYLYSINDEPMARLPIGTNELTFSHLRPGTYHFRVKAERYNHLTQEREFTVVVDSPWYATWWARMLWLALLAAIVWGYLRQRRRKEQDRLRMQEHIHAEQMSDAKLKFFMNISHEIRTPMTLIITPLLSLIKNENDSQRKQTYEIIKRNAERILHLINQMMDLRKIDKGLMQMHMTETDLVDFVRDLYSLFEHQAQARQIALSFEHDMERLPVWIDRKNFDKVVVNILSNAFKFTPTGGAIDIRLAQHEGQAVISISDNGEKIPEEKLSHIFDRFYQAVTTANDRFVGTGIGLDLARSLVELHHGSIGAHNLAQGCEFTVSIPLGNSHLTAEEMLTEEPTKTTSGLWLTVSDEGSAAETTAPSAMRKKTTIVLAEDDSEISDYLASELGEDYEVVKTVNGKEALSATLRLLPDLVLTDVMMAEMDGITLCSKIKANPSTNHIPVVLLTARSRDEDKLEGLETGADAYVVKPFNMDLLRQTISNIIGSHRRLRLKYERNDLMEEKIENIKMKSPDEKLMERVTTVVNQHLSDPALSVDMIASNVGISRVHLYRKMKELTGQTPHDFIRNIRLKNAAMLLAKKSMNVSEVTYACGFSNITSFSMLFKKFYGVSPREYVKEQGRGKIEN